MEVQQIILNMELDFNLSHGNRITVVFRKDNKAAELEEDKRKKTLENRENLTPFFSSFTLNPKGNLLKSKGVKSPFRDLGAFYFSEQTQRLVFILLQPGNFGHCLFG